ncbi:MAG: hypothetical protein GY805_14840 [Chloroflexi bacterium]|nr:hypothetical protein [Chloroflexota bacterium]
MSVNVMDEILSRFFLDGQFREQLRNNPEQTLATYDLPPEQRKRLFKLKKRSSQGKLRMSKLSLAKLNQIFSLN